MKVDVKTLDAGTAGTIELNDAVFGLEPRADILFRVVNWQLANRRNFARAARERSDVARTGKKFGRQKGGGTARHGDRRAPGLAGGGEGRSPPAPAFKPPLHKKLGGRRLPIGAVTKTRGGQRLVTGNRH